MDKNNIILLTAVLTSPVIAGVISSYFSKKKVGAEVHNLNITGEISIADMYQKYAIQQQKDKEELRREFLEKITEIKQEHLAEIERNKNEILNMRGENDKLKSRVVTLEGILRKNNINFEV